MRKTCFVVMAIGDQVHGENKVSASDLRKRYDDLIKEALLTADGDLDIVRADDVSISGSISSDIVTRLMHSDIVVADITYPNPNVFYELGLRHAFKPGSIIIRERGIGSVPFDVSHLRYVEYENTPSGLKTLSDTFKRFLDSHFQDTAIRG